MRKAALFAAFLVIILCFFAATTVSPAWAKQRRTALIIGNANYESAPLKNSVNDAQDIADALKNLGFLVTLKTDANQRTMERAIRDFGKELRGGGVGLFYFAGHGVQVRGNNYLVPIAADIESEGDVKYETVDAGLVLAKMEDAANGLNIIILDACRNNPFSRSFRSAERGLARMDAPTGSILAFSTAPGSVAADGTGRNGLYTSALLKHIDTPGIDLPHLFMRVRKDVIKETNRKQVPWESSSLIGSFYFSQQRGVAVTSKHSPSKSIKSDSPVSKSTVIAKIPPQPKVTYSRQNARNKVAILPFFLDSGGRILKERLLTSTIEAFHSRDFSVEWSCYKMSQYRSIRKIDDDMFASTDDGKIWEKKSVLSRPKLDLDMVYEIGKKLNVDIVIAGITKISTNDGQWINSGRIKMYIIDIKKQKVSSKMVSSTTVFTHSPEFVFNFESSLKLFIDEQLT